MIRRLPNLWLLLIVAGVTLRVLDVSDNRSLWLDEAFLALNLRDLTYSQLFGPLLYQQAAPPLFLVLAKFFAESFGPSEVAYRLVPLASSVLSVFLFAILCLNTLRKETGALALLLFVLSDRLVFYSAEFKPYSVDVLTCLISAIFATGQHLRGLSAYVVLAPWFSFSAMMHIPALLITRWLRSERDSTGLRPLIILGCLFNLSCIALYFISIENSTKSIFLLFFWRDAFMPSIFSPRWVLGAVFDLVSYMNIGGPVVILFLLFLVGLWRSESKPIRTFLLVLVAIALGFSYLKLYPFSDRLLLFLLPLVMIMISAGITYCVQFIPYGRALPILLIVVLMRTSIRDSAYHIVTSRRMQEIEPVLKYMASERQEGDRFYISQMSAYAYSFYFREYNLEELDMLPSDYADLRNWERLHSRYILHPETYLHRVLLQGFENPFFYQDLSDQLAINFEFLMGSPRVWVLICHGANIPDGGEADGVSGKILLHLERSGTLVKKIHEPGHYGGCGAYLYDLRSVSSL